MQAVRSCDGFSRKSRIDEQTAMRKVWFEGDGEDFLDVCRRRRRHLFIERFQLPDGNVPAVLAKGW